MVCGRLTPAAARDRDDTCQLSRVSASDVHVDANVDVDLRRCQEVYFFASTHANMRRSTDAHMRENDHRGGSRHGMWETDPRGGGRQR